MNKIEIYTSSTCNNCHMAMSYFQKNNIEYTEYNISEDETAKQKLLDDGIMGVPYIIVNGVGIQGLNIPKIKELLK